jgi:3-oxoacyl-ACP reductase-like protein
LGWDTLFVAASDARPALVTLVERVAAALVRVALEELLERTALEELLLEERVALPEELLERAALELLERTALELLDERVAEPDDEELERTALEELLEELLERVALLLDERVALLLDERVALVEEELLRVSWVDTDELLEGLALELDLVEEDDTELEDLVEEPEEEERVELLLRAVPLLFLVCASISGAVSMENPTNTEAAIVINFLIAS